MQLHQSTIFKLLITYQFSLDKYSQSITCKRGHNDLICKYLYLLSPRSHKPNHIKDVCLLLVLDDGSYHSILPATSDEMAFEHQSHYSTNCLLWLVHMGAGPVRRPWCSCSYFRETIECRFSVVICWCDECGD